MMKNRLLLTVIMAVLSLCLASPAFADDYQTTIDAFEYNGYSIPAYDGDPSEQVNGNLPTFSAEELTENPFVQYGDLDALGRCTPAFAELNQSLMPTGKRGSISSVYPTGWVQAKYDIVSGQYLYNRCHLIGWQLTGADLNNLTKAELSKNLITGTRFLNVGDGSTGMVEYENDVAAYIKEDADNFVSYRVTPVFFGNDLVAAGVLMEGRSVASNDVEFCVFCYNVQPEIAINYATGESRLASALPDNKSIRDCTITVGDRTTIKDGEGFVGVEVRDGDKILNEGSDYELVWQWNTQPGQGIVTVVGVGSYKDNAKYYFVILPAKAKIQKLQAKEDGKNMAAIRITAQKQEGVGGYQYSWRMPGKKWSKADYNRNVRIIKGLKKGKTYQVRIRAYKKINGEICYGKWSKVKTIRTK